MRIKRIASLALIPAALLLIAQFICLPQGIALFPSKRAFNSLKNRSVLPHEADFDRQITLAKLLQPGKDQERWSTARAAAIEGYVITVQEGSVESANCFSFIRRDTHIEVAPRPDAPPRGSGDLGDVRWGAIAQNQA